MITRAHSSVLEHQIPHLQASGALQHSPAQATLQEHPVTCGGLGDAAGVAAVSLPPSRSSSVLLALCSVSIDAAGERDEANAVQNNAQRYESNGALNASPVDTHELRLRF